MAISGEMPAFSLTRLFSACRLTPSARAAAVTVSLMGSRQVTRTCLPGCGGFFMTMCCIPSFSDNPPGKCSAFRYDWIITVCPIARKTLDTGRKMLLIRSGFYGGHCLYSSSQSQSYWNKSDKRLPLNATTAIQKPVHEAIQGTPAQKCRWACCNSVDETIDQKCSNLAG
jgi:hypothetical protein